MQARGRRAGLPRGEGKGAAEARAQSQHGRVKRKSLLLPGDPIGLGDDLEKGEAEDGAEGLEMMEPQLAPAAQDVGKGAVPEGDQALDLGDGAAILRKTLPQGLQKLLFRFGARCPRGSFLLHGPAFWMAGAGRKRCLGAPPEPWSRGGPAARTAASSIFRARVQEEPGSMSAVEKIRRHESDRPD